MKKMDLKISFPISGIFVILLVASSQAIELRGPPGDDLLINDVFAEKSLVGRINNDLQVKWKATTYDLWQGWSLKDFKKMLGANLWSHMKPLPDLEFVETLPTAELPKEFDARVKWPGLIHKIRNQQHCGSCWAFAATETLSDRVAIASGGRVRPVLSPEDMVSCDHLDLGCGGGILMLAWHYLKHTGVVTDACFPYSAGDGDAPKCVRECVNPGEPFMKYRTVNYYKVGGLLRAHPDMIRHEIMTNGPVEGAFHVYADFPVYKGGVYSHTSGDLLGGHAIKIIGWGEEAGEEYWLVANSWGEDWGEEGYFRIKRGVDECGIESHVYAGTPVDEWDTKAVPAAPLSAAVA